MIPNPTRFTKTTEKKALAQDTGVERVQKIRSTRKWIDEQGKGQVEDGTMMSFVAFSFIAVGLARSTEKASFT